MHPITDWNQIFFGNEQVFHAKNSPFISLRSKKLNANGDPWFYCNYTYSYYIYVPVTSKLFWRIDESKYNLDLMNLIGFTNVMASQAVASFDVFFTLSRLPLLTKLENNRLLNENEYTLYIGDVALDWMLPTGLRSRKANWKGRGLKTKKFNWKLNYKAKRLSLCGPTVLELQISKMQRLD